MKKLTIVIIAALGVAFLTGCTSAPKTRDVTLKGMYCNATTETLAIGEISITAVPDSIESFVAHYAEDTAWLSPSTKTHKLDLILTGTNAVASASNIVSSICSAFKDVAPSVAATHAANAKGGKTAFDVITPAAATSAATSAATAAKSAVSSAVSGDDCPDCKPVASGDDCPDCKPQAN